MAGSIEIQYKEVINHKATIDAKEAGMIALSYFEDQFQIDPFMWIEDGNLMKKVEYVTSHSWYADEVIRKASKLDKHVLNTVKAIHRRIYDGH